MLESAEATMLRAASTQYAEEEISKKKYQLASLKKLQNTIQKKLQTSFIGAISAFEEAFGDMWGHGLDEEAMTEKQYANSKKWTQVRNRILNNGNNQIRALENELAQYTITWNRYELKMNSPYHGWTKEEHNARTS